MCLETFVEANVFINRQNDDCFNCSLGQKNRRHFACGLIEEGREVEVKEMMNMMFCARFPTEQAQAPIQPNLMVATTKTRDYERILCAIAKIFSNEWFAIPQLLHLKDKEFGGMGQMDWLCFLQKGVVQKRDIIFLSGRYFIRQKTPQQNVSIFTNCAPILPLAQETNSGEKEGQTMHKPQKPKKEISYMKRVLDFFDSISGDNLEDKVFNLGDENGLINATGFRSVQVAKHFINILRKRGLMKIEGRKRGVSLGRARFILNPHGLVKFPRHAAPTLYTVITASNKDVDAAKKNEETVKKDNFANVEKPLTTTVETAFFNLVVRLCLELRPIAAQLRRPAFEAAMALLDANFKNHERATILEL